MKKILLTLSVFFAFTGNFYSQDLEWVNRYGSSGVDGFTDIAVTAQNNTISVGSFSGTVDFDPSASSSSLTATSALSGFVLNTDEDGNLDWVKAINSSDQVFIQFVALDPAGNIYLAGKYIGVLDADPGVPTVNLTSLEPTGDFFMIKLTSSGDFVWGKSIGALSNQCYMYGMDVDSNGNLYVVGTYNFTTDFDPDDTVYEMTPNGGNPDAFILKLNTNGSFGWAITSDNPIHGEVHSAITVSTNALYIAGTLAGSFDINYGAGVVPFTETGAGSSSFILKCDLNGNYLSHQKIESNGTNWVKDMTIDAQGNLIVAGVFSESMIVGLTTQLPEIFATDAGDGFIVKFDSNLVPQWQNITYGYGEEAFVSVDTDDDNNVYTAGYFDGVLDLDGLGIEELESNFDNDGLFFKLTANGNRLASLVVGGGYGDDNIPSIKITSDNKIYHAVNFRGTVDFDPQNTVHDLTSLGNLEGAIQKLTQCNTRETITEEACVSYTSPSGEVWLTSGTYTDTIQNVAGCDSIITIHLTIHPISNSTLNITSCGSYVWQHNGLTYPNSGFYSDTLQTIHGCDSIVSLQLIVNQPSVNQITISACDSYHWSQNNQTYTNSGMYNDTIPNAVGCDSIITLNLTIDQNNISIVDNGTSLSAVTAGDVQWVDCNDDYTAFSGENDPELSFYEIGSYAFISEYGACIDTSACYEIDNVGTNTSPDFADILIYPNPFSNKLQIELPKALENCTIRIVDMSGQQVYKNSFEVMPVSSSLNIELSVGIYMMEISSESAILFKQKLIKQ